MARVLVICERACIYYTTLWHLLDGADYGKGNIHIFSKDLAKRRNYYELVSVIQSKYMNILSSDL